MSYLTLLLKSDGTVTFFTQSCKCVSILRVFFSPFLLACQCSDIMHDLLLLKNRFIDRQLFVFIFCRDFEQRRIVSSIDNYLFLSYAEILKDPFIHRQLFICFHLLQRFWTLKNRFNHRKLFICFHLLQRFWTLKNRFIHRQLFICFHLLQRFWTL